MKIRQHGRFRGETSREKNVRAVAWTLGNYFTADDKNLKNQENRERMRTKREGEGRRDIRKERQNGEKGNENKAGARWPARRYKKDDERKGLIPRNVI